MQSLDEPLILRKIRRMGRTETFCQFVAMLVIRPEMSLYGSLSKGRRRSLMVDPLGAKPAANTKFPSFSQNTACHTVGSPVEPLALIQNENQGGMIGGVSSPEGLQEELESSFRQLIAALLTS